MPPHRLAMLAAACLAALTAGAHAAPAEGLKAEVLATVRASIEAGLAGDMTRLRAQYAPDCTFIDEFAPFFWSGPGALDRYLASGYRMYRETRHQPGRTRLSPASFVYMAADRAFVIEPLRGAATVRGRPYRADGAFAYTLERLAGRWEITSQTWTKRRESFSPY